MKKILLVVGTRPNYIKITQFKKLSESMFKGKFNIKIVHTGQHFDAAMADVFFKQLNIWPDYFLNISKASPNVQIAEIMLRLEEVIINQFKPDVIIVPGDVNSTLAAAICANKLGIPIGHLESGLRSFDRTMPEEINRILVDEISDLYFVTEQSGIDNLLKEGKKREDIHFVGNTMIDTLVDFEQDILQQDVLAKYQLEKDAFLLITMHRPATVDNKEGLESLFAILREIPTDKSIVFAMHPRTLNNIKKFELDSQLNLLENLIILEPLDYFSFQNLIHNCKMVLTDSGGIQEETTYKRKPCVTLRPNTERPITITMGTNSLVRFNEKEILEKINQIFKNQYKAGEVPPYWDGTATKRILEILEKY
jgi:UDP-N-acetylglucosamine 2-epimerase (non-hydrolysing)